MNCTLASVPTVALHLHLQGAHLKSLQEVLNSLIPKPTDHSLVLKCNDPRLHNFSKVGGEKVKQQRMSEVKPHVIFTQSISVVYFTLDTNPKRAKFDSCSQIFGKSPWKFHHVTELNSANSVSRLRFCSARQEYYELAPNVPLFSSSTVHYGKALLRFNIFTRNHSEMVKFYSKLFNQTPVSVRENFVYFTFPYTEDLTLQLSLRNDPLLMPYPMDLAELLVTLTELPDVADMEEISEHTYRDTDPDDNPVLLTSCSSCRVISTDSLNANTKKISSDSILCTDTEIPDRNKCDPKRPDVIPKQDVYTIPQQDFPQTAHKPKVTRLIRCRRRSVSPTNMRQKHVLHSSNSLTITPSKDIQPESNTQALNDKKRRKSVDIVETF